ncbi:MAG: alpha/beta fold hydrolase [Dehalococcoidales bacterium]|nr:MAG: alpha/beta fold hydrolase [Dehalococcoidales bacterium]
MPYADNDGVRIYYEIEGPDKPVLVMAHGGTGSLEDWRKHGYTDAFNDEFQLVLFDARGHGQSGRPHEASISAMADDVIAVLDSVGVAEANYWGYSMGSAIGLDLAIRHASRFDSFIFGGISPYHWPEAIIKPLIEARNEFAGNSEADVAILDALVNHQPLTDDELTGIDVPCLFYCGNKDPFHAGAKECVRHIQKARFVSLAGANHASVKADQIIPHVKKFLAEII